jgi:hypothetical protein
VSQLIQAFDELINLKIKLKIKINYYKNDEISTSRKIHKKIIKIDIIIHGIISNSKVGHLIYLK